MWTKKKGVWVPKGITPFEGTSMVGYNIHNDYNIDGTDTSFTSVKTILTDHSVITPPVFENGLMYVFNSDEILEVDINNFNIINSYSFNGSMNGFGAILSCNSTVFLNGQGEYIRHDINDNSNYSIRLSGIYDPRLSSLVANGYIYIGDCNKNKIVCYDLATDEFVNSYNTNNRFYGHMISYNNNVYVGDRNVLYKFDSQLNKLSEYSVGSIVYGCPTIVGDYLYISGEQGLYKFDLNLNLIKNVSIGDNGSFKIIYHDGYLYHCEHDVAVRQLNLDLNVIQSYNNSNIRSYNVLVSDNYLYNGSSDGYIYKINKTDFSLVSNIYVGGNTQFFLKMYNNVLYASTYNTNKYVQIT